MSAHFYLPTLEDLREAVADTFVFDAPPFLKLRDQVAGALDRPGDQLGKERDEKEQSAIVSLGGICAAIHVDGLSDRLERVEGYTDGKNEMGKVRRDV